MASPKSKSEVEAELKIRLSRRDLEKVFRALTGNADISHKFLPRMYYDSADLALHKAGVSLRVQYKQGAGGRVGGYEQTVKFALTPKTALGKGVLFRKECKNILDNHKPNMRKVADLQAQAALKPFKKKKLVHIFTAAIERRSFEWKLKNGGKKGRVEVAFDVGQVILPHNNRHRDFSEIEVEIKSGGPEFIDIVKNKILKIAPSARIQPLSKSEQGIRFYMKRGK